MIRDQDLACKGISDEWREPEADNVQLKVTRHMQGKSMPHHAMAKPAMNADMPSTLRATCRRNHS